MTTEARPRVRPWHPWEKMVLAVAWAVVLWGVVLTVQYCMAPGEVQRHLENVLIDVASFTSNFLLWRVGRSLKTVA